MWGRKGGADRRWGRTLGAATGAVALLGGLITFGVAGSTGAAASTGAVAAQSTEVSDASSAGGVVFPFGTAPNLGGLTGRILSSPVVGIAATPTGKGYWLVAGDGGIFSFGDAGFHGSTGAIHLNQPIVGIAPTPTGKGYWLVASDGGVFSFGDARFYGSTGNIRLNQPIVGMAATGSGNGYWLVAADGGVFSFGDARFHGSTGNIRLNQPIVGMAATRGGNGYWLVASDGGIFTFGDAGFHGSTGAIRLDQPIVGMAPTATGRGYWLVASDGGIFTFGDARFYGSTGGRHLPQRIVGMARSAGGYWLTEGAAPLSPFTPALDALLNALPETVTAAVEDLNTGSTFTFNPGPQLTLASTFKVEILGTLLAEAQAQGRGLTAEEQSLAGPMIEISSNADGQALFDQVGGAPAIQAWDDSIGMTNTTVLANWGVSTTTPTDQITLLNTFVTPNRFLRASSRAYGLYLLGHVEPSQVFGINFGPPPVDVRAAKTGRIPEIGCRNGIAWVDGDGRNYLIAVFVQNGPSDQEGEAAMEPISYDAWTTLG
jgi:hypothetical protein